MNTYFGDCNVDAILFAIRNEREINKYSRNGNKANLPEGSASDDEWDGRIMVNGSRLIMVQGSL